MSRRRVTQAPGGVVAANCQGLWAVDASGILRQVIRTGDIVTVSGSAKTVLTLTIFTAPAASTG